MISSATRRYLLADRLGSITNVVADNGTSLAINRYDESGIPSPANMGRFGYTGQTWLAGIGLWHYKARMYSPTLGRFMQTDPIGYGDGMNMYGYVGGDPVNSVDPTGLSGQCVSWSELVDNSRFDASIGLTGGIVVDSFRVEKTFCYSALDLNFKTYVFSEDNDDSDDPCSWALQESGQIEFGGNAFSLIFLGGITVSSGEWRNLSTGSHGTYKSAGGALGLGLGATLDYGKASSLSNFVGYGETVSGGVAFGPVGYSTSSTQNAALDTVSRGKSLGWAPPSPGVGYRKLGFEASAAAGETFIDNCHVH